MHAHESRIATRRFILSLKSIVACLTAKHGSRRTWRRMGHAEAGNSATVANSAVAVRTLRSTVLPDNGYPIGARGEYVEPITRNRTKCSRELRTADFDVVPPRV